MIESITDCAFSWPISAHATSVSDSSFYQFFLQGRGGPTLIVINHVTDVISSRIVCFAHAHGVVREVDIAVVACRKSSCALVLFVIDYSIGDRKRALQKSAKEVSLVCLRKHRIGGLIFWHFE